MISSLVLLLGFVAYATGQGEEKKSWYKVKKGVKCDEEYSLWEHDGAYLDEEIKAVDLCVKYGVVGCNAAIEPVGCDGRIASCIKSAAFFDEKARAAPHYVCSEKAHMTSKARYLSKTVPAWLCGITGCIFLTMVYLYYRCQHKEFLSVTVLLTGGFILLFSCLVFYSPFFYVGVAGVAAAAAAVGAHFCIADPETEREKVVRLVFSSMLTSFVPLLIVMIRRGTLLKEAQGAACSAFYDNYYQVDPLLLGPNHNSEIQFFGLCSRPHLTSSMWYSAGVISLSVLMGIFTIVDLAYRNNDLPPKTPVTPIDSDPDSDDFVGLKVLKSPYENVV
eukprot:TRINITY_DN21823_c0_g1_i4.p1 TRINITY_DN21823_c0_g1~~TRINITY_DN21823_c0_g1_i4.p1  ORF type:complete len:359 (+),score=53.45 TRINITY_DN21823_c0_g1_i4:79-1077(+)